MNKISLTGISAIFCFTAVFASAETYDCDLKGNRNNGWTPTNVVFDYIKGNSAVKLYDEISYSTQTQLVNATLRADNSVRVVMQWQTGRYRNPSAKPTRDMPSVQPVRIFYEATLLRGGSKLLLRAAPEGSNERYSARGSCTITNRAVETYIK